MRITRDGGATWNVVNTGMTEHHRRAVCWRRDLHRRAAGRTPSASLTTAALHLGTLLTLAPERHLPPALPLAELRLRGWRRSDPALGWHERGRLISRLDVRLLSVDFCGGFPVAVGEGGRIYQYTGTNWVLRHTEVNLATFNDVKFCGVRRHWSWRSAQVA